MMMMKMFLMKNSFGIIFFNLILQIRNLNGNFNYLSIFITFAHKYLKYFNYNDNNDH